MAALLLSGGMLLDPLHDQLLGRHDVLLEDGLVR